MSETQTKSELRRMLDSDLYRYYGNSSREVYRSTYKNIPGFRFTCWMRKCAYWAKKPIYTRLFFYHARWRYNKLKYKFGFDIEFSTDIGAGFYLGHWGGVVIHPQAVIGKNCNVSHQVTIGMDNSKGANAVPALGNNIYLAPGSKIFGKISLGDNCAVGANSVVNSDIPPGVTVAGVPAKVISEKDSSAFVIHTI